MNEFIYRFEVWLYVCMYVCMGGWMDEWMDNLVLR